MNTHHGTEALFCLGVKVIVRNQDNKILVLQLSNKKTGAFDCSCTNGCWELPGGRVQTGEDEITALYREMNEEAGITKLDNIRPIMMIRSDYKGRVNDQENIGYIFSMFHATVNSDAVVLSCDHQNYAWVDEQKAIELLSNVYVKDFDVLLSACR